MSAGRVRLAVVMSQVVAHFHLDPYVSSTAGFQQDVPNPVVVGDHISTILAGDCMVAEVIECITGAQSTLRAL